MIRRAFPLVALLFAGCMSTGFDHELTPPLEVMQHVDGQAETRIWVDERNHEVRVLAGPFTVPEAPEPMEAMDGHEGHGGHDDSMLTPLIPLRWPVEGGMQGFRLAAYDAEGNELPRDIMHHMIAVNFDRRQLVYPVPERLFGFGTETPDIRLPDAFEVPLERGDSIGMYAMWHNETGREIEGVYMHVALPYATPGKDREKVMPIYMDTNNHIGGKTSFDLPPGEFTKAYEFELPVSGAMLAASGHLHDYGVELRLEDAATDEVIFRLEADRGPDGKVHRVEQKIFRKFFKLIDARVPLEANRRYRVVGVYENPTDEVIVDGAMAHIVGLFAPDDPENWPELDRSTQAYAMDVEALPAPMGGKHDHEH